MKTNSLKEVLEQFTENTANHSMEVLLDDGKRRHLRFSENGSSIYHFNIVTWPGYLAISGDIGAYMFSRTADMFTFFRSEKEGLYINPSYWAEKLNAGGGGGGSRLAMVWSEDAFKQNVLEEFDNWAEEQDDNVLTAEVLKKLSLHVLESGYCEQEAQQALLDWDDSILDLSDFWERSCTDFDHHYLLCCYAIVWAIKQYDAAKQEAA